MAQFPSAVKTFTSKSDGAGNKIFASHINDIQDEVNAIEDTLLNASAPLNLQHVAATALSVSAGSTLTTLNVTGGSTFADVTVLAPVPSVRVTASSGLQVADATPTAVSFNVERWMTVAGMHSTSANPTHVLPLSTGVFTLQGCVSWAGGSTGAGVCALSIRIDGSSIIAQVQEKDPGGLIQSVATTYYFRSAAQYAELIVTQNSGSTKSLNVVNDYSPDLIVTKLR